MATTRSILATTGLLAAATLLAVGTASATGQGAEAGTVLTHGSTGGTAVAVGDVITASSSNVKISTTAGGSTGITCSQSSFSASVTANPTAPGTATESLDAFTIGGTCTSNIIGVTGVQSITANGLPRPASVTSAGGVIIQGPVSTTAVLSSLLGSVTCTYTGPSLSGTAVNATNAISFTDQAFTLSSGSSLCPGSAYLTATYTPVRDSSVSGSPSVFVN